jgi:hypothetical protein
MPHAAQSSKPNHPDNAPLNLVFYIEGKCGQVLDTFNNQYLAVKEYICHYRALRVADAKLVMVRNGIRYSCNPSGTPADYQ